MRALIDHKELVQQAYDLDPLPPNAARLASLITAQDPDLDEILKTVNLDQALTGKLLGFANSAASASRHPITTVKMAVVRLGLGTVLSYSIASCMRGRMDRALPAYGLAEGELWRHSIASAVSAECVATAAEENVPPAGYTAALLHDVGKLVIARNLSIEAQACIRRIVQQEGRSQLEAEVELLDIHHGELGGVVAEHWGLPQEIVEGIAHHHTPDMGRSPVCDLVHVANEVAKALPLPAASDSEGDARLFALADSVVPESLDRLGLDAEDLTRIAEAASGQLDDLISQFSAS